MTSEPQFAVLGSLYRFDSKKVHLMGGESKHPISAAHSLTFGYLGHTLCGRPVYQFRGGGMIGEFADDRLCWSCRRSFDGPKEALFVHAIPEEVGS